VTTHGPDGRLHAERDYLTYVETYADTPGVEIVDAREVRIRLAEADDDYLNLVYGARLDATDVAQVAREIVATVGRGGRPFYWTIWPSDGPTDLAERLVAIGFEDHGTDPLMQLDLTVRGALDTGGGPPALAIAEALDPETRHALAGFAVGSLGDAAPGGSAFADTLERLASEPDPRLRLFGGWVDGTLVTTSGLFTGAGLAGIIAVATSEAYRGRGFGRALTAAAMEAGRAAGMTTSTLMASELGQPVYRRLGFSEVGRVRFLRWPGGPAPA